MELVLENVAYNLFVNSPRLPLKVIGCGTIAKTKNERYIIYITRNDEATCGAQVSRGITRIHLKFIVYYYIHNDVGETPVYNTV